MKQELAKIFLNKIQANDKKQQMILSRMYQLQNSLLDVEDVGFNNFSQTYEDGILLYIFSLIGHGSRKLIDICSGNIDGSNTANLIINHDFKSLLVDCQERNQQQFYANNFVYNPPLFCQALVDRDNINQIISQCGFSGDVDLIDIDIDGNDYWIWDEINIKPRVVLIEYKRELGPYVSWTIPYNSRFRLSDYEINKDWNNYNGCSLSALVKLGKKKGYRLISCNRGGWNAFFLRDDIINDSFPEISVASCFDKWGMDRKKFELLKSLDWQEV